MNIISIIIRIINYLSTAVSYLYKYRTVYKAVGLFATRKFKKAEKMHKYAILIAARNEEAVIQKLIESIKAQDYPSKLVTVFVVADNCTDNTAAVARKCGAVCYERFDNEHKTKGYALQYLVECIRRDYSIEAFEGYFVFDADNLLKEDYISRMNDSFDSGEKIITSFRNTKNFDDNWISASYAVHWLRTIRNEHRARSLFRLATRIQGTGFLFANELIKDGWNYTSLTEDRAFCADAVAKGYRISYNNEAHFYDEQPTDIKIALRQRIRWAKGHLQAFNEVGGKLLLNIFSIKSSKSLGMRFMSFDMLTVVFPNSLFWLFKKVLVYLLRVLLILTTGAFFTLEYAPTFLKSLFNLIGIEPLLDGKIASIIWISIFTFAWSIQSYIKGIGTAIYIYIIEQARIKPMNIYKKIWFCLTFPLFDIIGKVSMCIALFAKVEWKPIPHNKAIGIGELEDDFDKGYSRAPLKNLQGQDGT